MDFTECTEHEYEVLGPTPTLDRICDALTTCKYKEAAIKGSKETMVIGEMESVAPGASSDRECGAITLCDEDAEYETAAPELADSGYSDKAKQPLHVVADRACTAVTACSNETEYETKAATRTTDRECAQLTPPCDEATQYEKTAATDKSDRECAKVSRECRVGEFQEQNATATTNRICTVCKAGSIDHDEDPLTKCAFCPGGSFQDREGQNYCRDSSQVCPLGTVETIATNRSTARVCEYCNGVSNYQDQAGQEECKEVSECEPGTYVAGDPTVSSDRKCTACDGVTEYQDKFMAPSCIPVSAKCGYGHFEKFEPQPDADRVCLPCPEGTFQDELFQTVCKEPTPCKAGTAEFTAPTRVADRICIACDGITGYQDEDNAKSCKEVAACDLRTQFVQQAATATSDTVCRKLTSCPENTFHEIGSGDLDLNSDRMCTTHRECEWPDEYEFKAPTSTSDRICARTTECRANHFEVSAPLQATAASSFSSGGGSGVAPAIEGKDRVCEKCTRCSSFGEFQTKTCDETSDATCETCTVCEAGVNWEESECSATEDATCTPCTVCSGAEVDTGFGLIWVGDYAAVACSVEADTQCTTCTHCRSWQYEDSRCTSTSDAVCEMRCGFEAESEEEGAEPTWNKKVFADGADANCADVTRCVWRDQFELTTPTPTDDRVCQNFTECDYEKEYQIIAATRTADRVCQTSTVCAEDGSEYEAEAPSTTADRHCMAVTNCTAEQYEVAANTADSDRDCKEKRVCGAFEVVTFDGNATANRECAPEVAEASGEAEDEALAATFEEREQTASMSGSGQFLVFVVVVIALAAMSVLYVRSGGVTMVGVVDATLKQRGAGVVEADADLATPFEGGDFWFVEESEVELAPLVHYLRPPPLGQFHKPSSFLMADSEYYSDSDSQQGEYIITQGVDAAAVPQLLSHTLSPGLGIQSPVSMFGSSSMMQSPQSQLQVAPPAVSPFAATGPPPAM